MAYLQHSPNYVTPPPEYSHAAISAAAARLEGHVHRTPVLENAWLNRQLGCRVFFKCEHFQRGGAFKIRGAMNSVLQLTDEQASRGVVTHSSGNHAQALAIAAQIRGISCTVVMPENSPSVKVQATQDRGATVVHCQPTQAARIAATQAIIDRTGATLVHPFDQANIILGQATAAWELLTEVPQLTAIFAPVGGGGLLSGTCLAANWFHSDHRVPVFAAEPVGADDAFRSLQQQSLVTEHQPKTIADGLLTTLGQCTWPIIRSHVRGIVTVTDEEITAAMRIFWERLKWVVEPSGAVSLAGLRQWLQQPPQGWLPSISEPSFGVIISGGNRDFVSSN